ncbi:DUF922 domain-containing protein [Mucilaginibacter sp. Bleaf8]|uniref:DUF922 domain-containing protein n=1 Tax=Mucilaginibacter sp. Bleaf8 TaxID=2834430 RepID=UPI001BCF468B|nr:DUF922 domain-containing protein [Mucilaginibacter sp. Bleaf8]MBS7566186.1 DUF922 domain-containing protein [Mucilaginibacter sp. Bleaf8]
MKKLGMRVWLIVAMCLSAISWAKAQQLYRQLTPNDFAGNVPVGSEAYIAYTNCSVTMNYQANPGRNGYYQLAFDVQLVMNRNKSWMNRQRITSPEMMAEVLRHEQGHYQLAYLMRQEMQSALSQARYTNNYQAQVNEIFNHINQKYKQLNADYDEDTNHMLDRKQQNAWIDWLNKEVSAVNNLAMND